MYKLNLVYPEQSDYKFEVQKFPDGQQGIVIKEWIKNYDSFDEEYQVLMPSKPTQIISRLNNFMDLELIICATKALRNLDCKEIHLVTPYFVGARSDKAFYPEGVHYLKQVICPIINSLGFKTVTVRDAHSDVLEACIDNLVNIHNDTFVEWALADILSFDTTRLMPAIFIAPDASAYKKLDKLTNNLGYTDSPLICTKMRDEEGKLSRVNVPIKTMSTNAHYVLIDDICDGGATFINISRKIHEIHSKGSIHPLNVHLVVTHGIFSKGFKELLKYFNTVYCTNSYKDIKDYNQVGWNQSRVKQLNIF